MTGNLQLSLLDQHFADFIQRIDNHPCEELWVAAALLSNAAGQGHVCLDLAVLPRDGVTVQHPAGQQLHIPEHSRWLEALGQCGTVGQPGAYTPLVLDDAGRLYLHRYWEYERLVAESILLRSAARYRYDESLNSALEQYFPSSGTLPDYQKEAARSALTCGFTVITGGPGVGKSATVARILAVMTEVSVNQPRIMLVTPTGKAALRLKQSIEQAMGRLTMHNGKRPALPTEVATIHRLLGIRPGGASCRYNRNNRLSCDLLVVDEASMVDLPLMSRLLEALPDTARVILLGDSDQLASVEAGAVLSDICAGLSAPPEAKEHCPAVVRLTRSYRFGHDSGIGNLSRLVNAGESDAALELLVSGSYSDLSWRQLPAGNAFTPSFMDRVKEGYSLYGRSETPEAALDALNRFRVLTPHRKGVWGVENLNRLCAVALGLTIRDEHLDSRLTPVMVTGNDYESGLFNGDTGVVMNDPATGNPAAWFRGPDAGLLRFSTLRLPSHEMAFALTVHKSQGSEFDRVLLVLPEQVSEALGRELLYTALTRSISHVEIWGTEEVFRRAVERRAVRSSGLRERLHSKLLTCKRF